MSDTLFSFHGWWRKSSRSASRKLVTALTESACFDLLMEKKKKLGGGDSCVLPGNKDPNMRERR